jgi:RHS repeat-associated protein
VEETVPFDSYRETTDGCEATYLVGGRVIARRELTRSGSASTCRASPGDDVAWFTDDHLGGTNLLTDRAGGRIAASVSHYLPFGELVPAASPGSPPAQAAASGGRQFTSQRRDATGLYDFGARPYDPVTGRFTQADDLEVDFGGQTHSPYSYVLNNPLRLIDPTGHQAEACTDECSFDVGEQIESGGVIGGTDVTPTWGLEITGNPGVHASCASCTLFRGPPEDHMSLGEVMDKGLIKEGPLKYLGEPGRPVTVDEPIHDPTAEILHAAAVRLFAAQVFGVFNYTLIYYQLQLQALARAPSLVHLTTAEGGLGIQESGTLVGARGIYAGPLSNAGARGLGVTLRTGLDVGRYQAAVRIPQIAAGNFSRVFPVGPWTAWQRAMGVVYSAPGSINLTTGLLTRSGFFTSQAIKYGLDVTVMGVGEGVLYKNTVGATE